MRRPVLSLVAASRAPARARRARRSNLETDNGALRQFDPDDETRQGFEAAAAVDRPGRVVAGARARRATAADVDDVRSRAARATARSRACGRRSPRDDGASALRRRRARARRRVRSRRRSRSTGCATRSPAERRRSAARPRRRTDFKDLITGSMWKIILFVLGLSFLVLLVLLRSVVLPLKAVLMNLLSVGAAYGVLTLVFDEVDAITPPLVLAVVFGLSMDYEVFLLSRIRERYNATGDTRRAVAEGLATSARTITSAALIMVAVFLVFVTTGLPSIQQIGLGAAVAIAVDATIVRLVLVPAAMELLGQLELVAARPLARMLPEANFEAARAPEAPCGRPRRSRPMLRACRIPQCGDCHDRAIEPGPPRSSRGARTRTRAPTTRSRAGSAARCGCVATPLALLLLLLAPPDVALGEWGWPLAIATSLGGLVGGLDAVAAG